VIKESLFLFLISFILFIGHALHADQLGCQLTPKDINEQATDIVKMNYANKTQMPDNLILYTTARANFGGTDGIDFHLNAEGFLRPLSSESYVLFAPLFITVKLSRKSDVLYLCAHGDDEFIKTHATLYFLSGYGLERGGIKNGVSNLFHPPSLKISPLKISVFGLSQGIGEISSIFGHIPILNVLAALPLEILKDIQNDLEGAISEIGGLGVERIVLRADNIEIATGIDINDPTKAKIIKTIPLHKALILKYQEMQNPNLEHTDTE
jgi:hypothetical protein